MSLDWSASLSDILKLRQQCALSEEFKVGVKYVKLMDDGAVIVFMSDETVFEYDIRMKLWREVRTAGSSGALASEISQQRDNKQ